jgi:glycosyltransferase involved in cell wall biosynthesis
MKHILILYRELAGYTVSCINHLCARYGVRADVVAYPLHPDAPFQFSYHDAVRVFPRNDYPYERLEALVRDNRYDLIFCGGWSDRDYLRLVRRNQEIPALLAFDKQWLGQPRDLLGALYLRMFVTGSFRFAFVPGYEQRVFAEWMGFRNDRIYDGVYACDRTIYEGVYHLRKGSVSTGKRKMWYAGRYVHEKSVTEMFEQIVPMLDGELSGWELHCMGTGPLWDSRPVHPSVYHHGFVQPEDTGALIAGGEIFIMPSKFEPWGLTVHEFASAGYALLLSDRVGARCSFLEEGINGFSFCHTDWSGFRARLRQMCAMTPERLAEMGDRSHYLASLVSMDKWAEAILEMIERGNRK